jgi:hypothetical protein
MPLPRIEHLPSTLQPVTLLTGMFKLTAELSEYSLAQSV